MVEIQPVLGHIARRPPGTGDATASTAGEATIALVGSSTSEPAIAMATFSIETRHGCVRPFNARCQHCSRACYCGAPDLPLKPGRAVRTRREVTKLSASLPHHQRGDDGVEGVLRAGCALEEWRGLGREVFEQELVACPPTTLVHRTAQRTGVDLDDPGPTQWSERPDVEPGFGNRSKMGHAPH